MAKAKSAEEAAKRREELRRVRRKTKRERKAAEDWEDAVLAGKPITEWDPIELAHGRPRNSQGNFRGPKPRFITREVHEQAVRMFVDHTQTEVRALVPKSLATLEWLLETDEADKRGRPLVPASAKLEAAKFVVEHVIGKPRQPVDMDISVKLSAILANVMVQPGEPGALGLVPAVAQDFVDAEVVEDDEG